MNNEKKIKFDPNPLFNKMISYYVKNKDNEFWIPELKNGNGDFSKKRIVICNEGGSRSGKTYDLIHLIYYFCTKINARDRKLQIHFYRDTLKSAVEKLYEEDFVRCLSIIGDYDAKNESKPRGGLMYKLYGHEIHFKGISDDLNDQGYATDICFFNEALEAVNENYVTGMIKRCRLFAVADWNPSRSEHFIYNYEGRDNVLFTHTTHWDNPKLEDSIRAGLLETSPYDDKEVKYTNKDLYYNDKPISKENQPPPNINNINNNSVDEAYWRTYVRGVRGALEGLIFKKYSISSETPKDEFGQELPHVIGLDFGFTNDPTSAVKYWEDDKHIYAELIMYNPYSNPEDLAKAMNEAGISKTIGITCDSADRYAGERGVFYMFKELKSKGWKNIKKVKKSPKKGNAFWLQKMAEKELVIIKTNQPAPNWAVSKYKIQHMWEILRLEISQYVWMKVAEGQKNKPEDNQLDHGLDSWKYAYMGSRSVKRKIRAKFY